jgi:hypothetical protein
VTLFRPAALSFFLVPIERARIVDLSMLTVSNRFLNPSGEAKSVGSAGERQGTSKVKNPIRKNDVWGTHRRRQIQNTTSRSRIAAVARLEKH